MDKKPIDIHAEVARRLFNLPEGPVPEDLRCAAKNATYRHLYSHPYLRDQRGDYVAMEDRVMAFDVVPRWWNHPRVLRVWGFFRGPQILQWYYRHFGKKLDIKPIPIPAFSDDLWKFLDKARKDIATASGVPPDHISPTGRTIDRRSAIIQSTEQDKK